MKTPAFWSDMREYFLKMWGLSGSAQQAPDSPLQELLSEVERTTNEALEAQDARRRAEFEESQRLEQQQMIERESSFLREDILQLHQQLNTRLELSQLTELSNFIRHHWHELGLDRRAEHLAELTLRAVAFRLHRESLVWGWGEFCRLFQEHRLEWPAPLGLSPHATPQEYEQHRQMDSDLLKKRFQTGEILRMSDLMLGSVPVWGPVFPDRGGIVWRHSVFEAVAGALALSRLRELDRLAHAQRPELELRLTEVLSEPLRKIEERLRSPFASREEDKLLAERAQEICQNQAAEVVWQMLCPQLKSGERA